jgi:hypothetical protein
LIKASIYFPSEEYENMALALLDYYKDFQTETGAFRIVENAKLIMAHPHCYATESYLYASYALKRPEFLKIAERASDWLRAMQNSDGSLFRTYEVKGADEFVPIKERLKTSDATAQATRIWKLLGVNRDGIEKAYGYLHGELRQGGLRLFKSGSLANKVLSWRGPIYSWPTFFYLHSLILPLGEIEYCRQIF